MSCDAKHVIKNDMLGAFQTCVCSSSKVVTFVAIKVIFFKHLQSLFADRHQLFSRSPAFDEFPIFQFERFPDCSPYGEFVQSVFHKTIYLFASKSTSVFSKFQKVTVAIVPVRVYAYQVVNYVLDHGFS